MERTESKNISLLGSTGSIGANALEIIRENPDKYRIVALGAGKNVDLLLTQIKDFNPEVVCVLEEKAAEEIRERLAQKDRPEVLSGMEGFKHIAALENADTVISAMTGASGLIPTFEAIKAGKDIALANKETIVMAGPLVMDEAQRRGVTILPIDSEHSAILQSLKGHHRSDVLRIVLTASGGPFRDFSLEQMKKVTPAQALNHPNWDMGAKISIDSATMMNKGLEAIEAKWLFGLDIEQISILIHPQSIVHSMVEFVDKSIIAQLSVPDMRIPIAYALAFPRHIANGLSSVDLSRLGSLTFENPDFKKFKCLSLALEAARRGRSMPAVLNGANEIAVMLFLEGRIGFTDIAELIEETMEAHKPFPVESVEEIIEADNWAREKTRATANAKG